MLQGESRQKHLDCGFSLTISFVFVRHEDYHPGCTRKHK